ncbi:V-set and immunoglobulin domain-containing protein 2 isoform X1 [Antennarius striatus]|uniref:V-set and immunoglobulin domain-containing protein 2 isoform X1 n=1 Tax=Antennarius striatus TaxID=241820 RepID=UPI0035AE0BE7
MPGFGHQLVGEGLSCSHSAMGSSGRWIIWMLCVCCSAQENVALRVTMRESSLQVVQGDYVVLPCSFFTSSPLSRLNIIWTLAPFSSPEVPTQVIVYDHGQVIEDPALTGRVGFTGVPWSADIFLNDTRVSDAGIYRCLVNNPPETASSGINELELRVLTPPSLPLCQWDGDADAGGSVTLSCSVEEGVPTPEIHWEKLDPEKIALPINMEGLLFSLRGPDRFHPDRQRVVSDVRFVSLLRHQRLGDGELLRQSLHLHRSSSFLGRPAGRAADPVHVRGAVGAAGAPAVAPSHRTGRVEVEEGEGGVLRHPVHVISALVCLILSIGRNKQKNK